MVVLGGAGTLWLERSRLGQYLMALREDEEAAEASGVPTFRCKIIDHRNQCRCDRACRHLLRTVSALHRAGDVCSVRSHAQHDARHDCRRQRNQSLDRLSARLLFGLFLAMCCARCRSSNSREAASLVRIGYGVVLIISCCACRGASSVFGNGGLDGRPACRSRGLANAFAACKRSTMCRSRRRGRRLRNDRRQRRRQDHAVQYHFRCDEAG